MFSSLDQISDSDLYGRMAALLLYIWKETGHKTCLLKIIGLYLHFFFTSSYQYVTTCKNRSCSKSQHSSNRWFITCGYCWFRCSVCSVCIGCRSYICSSSICSSVAGSGSVSVCSVCTWCGSGLCQRSCLELIGQNFGSICFLPVISTVYLFCIFNVNSICFLGICINTALGTNFPCLLYTSDAADEL